MSTQLTRLPTGTVVGNKLASSTGKTEANLYQDVDDPIGSPDDASSYLYWTSSPASGLFSFANPAIPSGSTINFVRVFFRGYTGASGFIAPNIKVGGAEYPDYGNMLLPDQHWVDFTDDWLTNPRTGSPWTVADINGNGGNALQAFGYMTLSTTEEHVTQTYLTIEITAPARPKVGGSLAGGRAGLVA